MKSLWYVNVVNEIQYKHAMEAGIWLIALYRCKIVKTVLGTSCVLRREVFLSIRVNYWNLECKRHSGSSSNEFLRKQKLSRYHEMEADNLTPWNEVLRHKIIVAQLNNIPHL
jgi:hypothetical protein